ncbi:hypothetical protein Aperf_G00000100741 [Anoplocephala perfoliata]
MNNPSEDLISFTEQDKNFENSKINSLLKEFDPLFGIGGHELSTVPRSSSLPANRKAGILRKGTSNDESRSLTQNRIGGFFDKDLVWDELNEFVSQNKPNQSNSSIVPSPVTSSAALPPLEPCRSSPFPKQESPVSFFLCDNISVDKSLLNFAKAVENCVPWLPCVEDKFSSSQCSKPEIPISLNGYLFDGIIGSFKSFSLGPDTSQKPFDDWRVNPSLQLIPDRFPPSQFLPVNAVDTLASCTLKIYVPRSEYAYKHYEEDVKKYSREPLKTVCPISKSVSVLMKECLQEVYKDAPTIPKVSDFCFRILGRTDLLHPHATLGDHEYIQNSCRTLTDVYLVLEPCSMQELFLPTPEDRNTKLVLHDLPNALSPIPDRVAIEESLKKIGFYADKLLKQIPMISKNTMVAVGDTCGRLKTAVEYHISKICHRTAIYSLLETMESLQCCLHHLIKNKTKGQVFFLTATDAPDGSRNRSLCSPNLISFLKTQAARQRKRSSDNASDQEAVKKLAVLELQVIRQTIAFLKWKQAWHPQLQLSIARSAPLIGSTIECERLLGCHITEKSNCKRISKSNLNLVLRIGGVIDPNPQGSLNSTECYRVHVALTYAGRPLSIVCPVNENEKNFAAVNNCPEYEQTVPVNGDSYYSRRVDFKSNGKIDEWIRFLEFRLRHLPRETMLNVSLISCKKETRDLPTLSEGTLHGWVNVPLFDPNGQLRQGVLLAGLWPSSSERPLPEMRPTFSEPNRRPDAIVVELGFQVFEYNFYFTAPPSVELSCEPLSNDDRRLFAEAASVLLYSPTLSDQQQTRRSTESSGDLKFTSYLPVPKDNQHLIDQLWSIRGRLTSEPELLMALLIAAPVCWPTRCRPEATGITFHDKIFWMNLLSQLYSLVQRSVPLTAAAALRLLLPDVPDQVLRHWAVSCIAQLPPDAMICYLSSLVAAVNYDLYLDWSGLVSLLLHRATISLRFCNALYWNIESALMNQRWHTQQRLLLLKTALIWLRGSRLKATWKLQSDVLAGILTTAKAVKTTKDRNESQILIEGLQSIQALIDYRLKPSEEGNHLNPVKATPSPDGFRLPFDFGFCSRKLNIEHCTYIPSFNRPIEIFFTGIDKASRNCIYKVGDDLQMDLLICQLTLICDRIWLTDGLDLCVPHFSVMPHEPKCGIIESVTKSRTLKEIKEGTIDKNRALLAWLEKVNEAAYFKKAVRNFMISTVAGSVLTYVLGIGDRHNDNIMMRTNGQSFHIDFAKVFGNFQKILTFNRDRSPFILTPDMLEVVKTAESTAVCRPPGKDKLAEIPSFVHHCCKAYNALRKQSLSIIGILEMAWQMQLPGLTRRQVHHVYGNLRQNISEVEAEVYFKALILHSIQALSPQVVNGFHEMRQKVKKQPGKRDILNNEDKYSTHGPYIYLSSANLSSNMLPEIRPARIIITESLVSQNGNFVKDNYNFLNLTFKFELFPETKALDANESEKQQSRTVIRDIHDLKRLVWSFLGADPNCIKAKSLLKQLSELDDQIKNCATPTPPSSMFLDDLKTSLVDFIQFYAKDPKLVNFWTPTAADSRPELPHRSTSASDDDDDEDDSNSFDGDIFPKKPGEFSQSGGTSTPGYPAVKLTLQLSASCERLNVIVDQGHDWFLQVGNLTPNCIIDARISANSARALFDQRSVAITSSNPVLNERFTLDVPSNQCENASLILTVRQLDTMGARHMIGDAVVPLCNLPKQSAIGPNTNVVTRWYELSRRTFERV